MSGMAGAVVVLFARTRDAIRWTTLGTTLLTFVLSLLLLSTYNWQGKDGAYAYLQGQNGGVAESANGVVQMVQHARWIPAFNIEYRVGIDGLSLPLVILSTFICVLACIASWNIEKMTKGYMQHAKKRIAKIILVIARRHPAIARPKPRAEWMHRHIEPSGLKIKIQFFDQIETPFPLLLFWKILLQK